MSPEKLVRMANQIGLFFKTQNTTRAPAEIADHLVKNWDPMMRRAIVAHWRDGGAGLDPLVAEAVAMLPQAKPAG